MYLRSWIGLLACLWFISPGAAVRAADADEGSQARVVLVGIDNYADENIKSRKHAEADATALYDLFTNKDFLGVDPKNVKLLLGKADQKRGSQEATHANVLKAVQWLGKTARKDDLVIFAFFGNGAPLGDRGCYFTVDSTYKDRAKNALAAAEIEGALDNLQSQRFVVFLDCNFMGFKADKGAPEPNLANFYREYLGNDEAPKAVAPSRVVFLANRGTKPSLNLEKQGIFAQAILNGLSGKADQDGYEPDGNITIGELVKFVRKEQPKLSREHGKSDEDKAQVPIVFEFQSNDFIIDHNPTAYPKTRERLEKFDKLALEKKFDKDIAEEGHNLLARMPKLEAQQNLRKIYQKLADGQMEEADFTKERLAILETTQLADREAQKYAVSILGATKLVRGNFFQDAATGTLVDYAVRGMFREVNEKIPSAIKEKLDTVKSTKEPELLKLLAEARKHLGKREDLANGKDVTFSLHFMLGKLDKHTDYLDPETLTNMERDIRGNFSGIGVQIRKNDVKDMLQVITPIQGSPAYKAKMYAGDIITTIIREVDSQGKKLPEPEVITTKGMTTEEAVKKILGKAGTKVKLLVEREGEAKPIEFNLIRGNVQVESVLGHKRNNETDTWNYVIDPENKICYVRLTQFSFNTSRDLENLMKNLSKVGIKGFILDLRFNPGGVLDGAVKISDLFMDDGLIVTIRPRNAPETTYIGKSDGSYLAFPMVCLVNGSSASASEIVAGCLQDHGRAIILGTRSFGKGSVQSFFDLDTGGKLKLTTATYWRPSGKNIHRASTGGKETEEWGVSPSEGFAIKLSPKELNDLQEAMRESEIIRRPGAKSPDSTFKDRQLDAALDYLRQQIKTAQQGPGGKKAG